ncbi:FIST C-terminal domain-containing protein [Heliobacterium chlorum]|uniref:FIST C-terminal domain-containing protein n=1 Tax=Heliobacterium chlorum TaxID=2698 RepID=A0ABR7SZW6_HELCL|nr:FIST N-terminal domain-containing protein [Heliobacterium chlorum]MBC9784082.1 FIST C-terminal domain-containing protein [Heliobacterium chlorum]
MKHMVSVFSQHLSPEGAVREIAEQIKSQAENIKIVLFFASSKYEPLIIGREMKKAFPDSIVVGCTTAGELANGKVLNESIVATALDDHIIHDVAVAVIKNLSKDINVTEAFGTFERHFQVSMQEMDFEKYVGLVLVDGLSMAEERLMDIIGTKTDVHFVGGSAGDDLQFKTTFLFCDGEVYTDAALLVVLKPGVPHEIVKTQSFAVTDRILVATKVDEVHRTVYEFNGEPAAEAYAKAIGRPVEELEKYFMCNPVGLVAAGEPFVRSPQKKDRNKMVFYCNIIEGMNLYVLEPTDIIKETSQVLDDLKQRRGQLLGIIQFNCILRTLELLKEGRLENYGELFVDIPMVGFSTYGEQYFGHINQTATMLVLGE